MLMAKGAFTVSAVTPLHPKEQETAHADGYGTTPGVE